MSVAEQGGRESCHVLVAGGLTASGEATGMGEMVIVGESSYSVQQLDDVLSPARHLHTATKLRTGWIYLCGGLPDSQEDSQPSADGTLFVPKPACR